MLSKLMYHEFKATRRVFFPAYGIMLALAVISSVFMILSSNLQRLAVPLALLLLAYVLSLFAVGVLSFVYMIVRSLPSGWLFLAFCASSRSASCSFR